ncbi:hypothetical protein GCM10011515_21560 [Tsuneonella deserti]|uniref:Acyltransferase 3 domain-containing protein n=1 Tax=Tsuneonella deserti TaxID=2035528 RepID=A0ABQ1S928_9SPHN|nr:hypothetical protein GCM10011515_21560 [Tsuneonella deserti]
MGKAAHRTDIDGLRSLAILPVVFNHAGLPFAPGGFVGVDIFFVISGFLITGIVAREINNGNFSILNFYDRRIRRIMPALLTMIAVCFAGGWLILLPTEFVAFAKSAVSALLFSSKI